MRKQNIRIKKKGKNFAVISYKREFYKSLSSYVQVSNKGIIVVEKTITNVLSLFKKNILIKSVDYEYGDVRSSILTHEILYRQVRQN